MYSRPFYDIVKHLTTGSSLTQHSPSVPRAQGNDLASPTPPPAAVSSKGAARTGPWPRQPVIGPRRAPGPRGPPLLPSERPRTISSHLGQSGTQSPAPWLRGSGSGALAPGRRRVRVATGALIEIPDHASAPDRVSAVKKSRPYNCGDAR